MEISPIRAKACDFILISFFDKRTLSLYFLNFTKYEKMPYYISDSFIRSEFSVIIN